MTAPPAQCRVLTPEQEAAGTSLLRLVLGTLFLDGHCTRHAQMPRASSPTQATLLPLAAPSAPDHRLGPGSATAHACVTGTGVKQRPSPRPGLTRHCLTKGSFVRAGPGRRVCWAHTASGQHPGPGTGLAGSGFCFRHNQGRQACLGVGVAPTLHLGAEAPISPTSLQVLSLLSPMAVVSSWPGAARGEAAGHCQSQAGLSRLSGARRDLPV